MVYQGKSFKKYLSKILGTCSVSSRCAVVVNTLDQIRPESGVKPDCACVLLWVCLNVHFCARDRWQQRTFKKKKKTCEGSSRGQLCGRQRIRLKKGRKRCDQKRAEGHSTVGTWAEQNTDRWEMLRSEPQESIFQMIKFYVCFIGKKKPNPIMIATGLYIKLNILFFYIENVANFH